MFNPILPLLVRIGRAELVQSLISAGYLAIGGTLLWAGVRPDSGHWPGVLGCLVVLGGALVAWRLSVRRSHLIRDTPTNRIRSAAQGYVEIVGEAALFPGQSPLAFNGLPPCIWYEVVVTDNASLSAPQGGNWVKVSDEVFLLRDETGQCVVDPERAEIHSARERRWAIDGSRYRARYLMVGDLVHVMGELSTQRAHDGSGDRRAHVAELLRTWKRDPSAMLRRFDKNDDGEIDMDEYRHAVREAEREATIAERELRTHPEVHLMSAPRTGYPYILSDQDPHVLAHRFRIWSWFHAAMALLFAGLLMQRLGFVGT